MELIKQEHPFTILQLTDLHIGSMPFHEHDEITFRHVKEMTEKINPDLIIITGDLIWSEGVNGPERSYDRLLEELNKLQKPIAITYGNHDSEEGITRSQLREMEEKLDMLAAKKHMHIVNDRASYCVEIKNKHNQVEHIVYLMDTGALDPLKVGTYEYVHPEQVAWFNAVAKQYQQNGHAPKQDLMFIHIPLPEYHEAFLNGKVSGQKKESISSPQLNTGLFASILLQNNVAGLFCGHDHDNDYEAEYHGVRLCYGRISGFQCYGDLVRGARVIEIKDNQPSFDTYIVETTNYQHYK